MDIELDKDFLQSFNVTSLQKFVDWKQLEKISQSNNLQPDSALALASFIGKSGGQEDMRIPGQEDSRTGGGEDRRIGGQEGNINT